LNGSNKTIIFVSTNIKKEGAEKSLVALQSFLNHKGISTLTVIPQPGLIEELFQQEQINYIVHPFVGSINSGYGRKILRGVAKWGINYIESFKLRKRLANKAIKVLGIHSNTITTDFGYHLANRFGVPHIWHIREFGKLDFNFDFELGMGYMRNCTGKAAKIICNSDAVKAYYSQFFDNEKLVRVYNGVPLRPSGKSNWEDKVFRILLIGRLSKEKGQEEAVRACKILYDRGMKDFCLDLYGDGADAERLQKLIGELQLDNHIHLKGYSNNIPIRHYHVGLMCSPHEAFGRVTVEYMVNGIPVIGVNAGGTPEIVDENSGLLYDSGNIERLYEVIKRLYEDRSMCMEMGRHAQLRATSLFSEQQYCENVLSVYNEVFC
jgi:glycosyltransferase involved in cell wall biosynthesis